MSTSTLGLFLRHLALSEEVSRLGTASDHNLLAVYEAERGQAAFTELMRRHGPMVLRTCRRVLGEEPDAEDAFQATFVLLARKAGSINKREALGGWLHRVAYHTALKVLTGKVRRRIRERQARVMTQPDPDPSAKATWNEIRPILDAELDALPDEARRLLIACHLQEKTHAEAAAELGLPRGSVAWRLEKARALLAERLARRGIVVSATVLAVLLGESAKGAGVPAVLLVHTVEAARAFSEQATGIVSEHVARLVKGGLANMAKGSTHLSIALVGWVGLLGAGLIACQTLKAWPDETPPTGEPPIPLATGGTGGSPVERPDHTDRFGDPLPAGALARLGTMRLRHAAGVHSLAFTRDGKGLITVSKSDPARLWDVATGRMLRQFGDNRDNQVSVAALSPDGRTLAGRMAPTGKGLAATGDLCLWDMATGKLLQRLKAGRGGGAGLLAFSPDGKTVASADGRMLRSTLRLWETATGKELWVAERLEVAALTYSADGKALIWAGDAGDLHLWDAATGKELRRWDDDKERRRIMAFARAPDGRLFVASDPLGKGEWLARLWDVATGKEVWRLADEEARNIAAAAFSPDGKVLATGGFRRPIRLWDAATGRELRHCDGCRGAQSLAFSPDGKMLASGGGGDQTVHFWDVGSGREVRRAEDGHQAAVCSVSFTPDGQDIVASSWEGSLRVWDAATGQQRRRILSAGDEPFAPGRIASIASAVSPDGKTLIAATWDGLIEGKGRVRVRLWDRESGREMRRWSREGGWLPTSWAFSPDGKTVACMINHPRNHEGLLLEVATGKGQFGIPARYLAFSPDGKLLATARGEPNKPGSVTLWEAATGKELCSVPVPEGHVHGLLFSPDGRMLATASPARNTDGFENRSNVIHLWPLLRDESRKAVVRVGPPRVLAGRFPLLVEARGFPFWLGGWAFSPDGRTLALASEGGTIRLLETATGKERSRFVGHSGDVMALSFAPDGRRLASGSCDTTLLVWDVTGRLSGGRQPPELRPVLLSDKELEKLWADLVVDDAGRAGHAIWTLTVAPDQAVPYLRERLRTSVADVKALLGKVPQLLRDLDDDAFAVREQAKAELARLGVAAEPALRRALEKSPSVETRRSLEQLLKGVEAKRGTLSGESLRGVRTLEVLEHIGSREARRALQALTADAGTALALTHEARLALERLERTERR